MQQVVGTVGGPQEADRARPISGDRQNHARRRQSDRLLIGKSQHSARDFFYYFSGATPAAVRYKNWKMYYQLSQPGAEGWMLPLVPLHWTDVDNIKRDPFEQALFLAPKTGTGLGGALDAPATAYQYDWNMLPIGQQLWLKWFETLRE